jgi:hypothetical protein
MALCFSALALIAAAWVAYEVHGKSAAALLATILLLIAPPFLANLARCAADLPAQDWQRWPWPWPCARRRGAPDLLWLGAGLAWGFSLESSRPRCLRRRPAAARDHQLGWRRPEFDKSASHRRAGVC